MFISSSEELLSPKSKKPITKDLIWLRDFLLSINSKSLSMFLTIKSRLGKRLANQGTDFYIGEITQFGYKGLDSFFQRLEGSLSEAIEVWMCVGEMGFRMMERPELLHGLNVAHEKNGAKITIVYGPNVDPKTHAVFELAQNGIVRLYRSEKFMSDHFIWIKNKEGETVLIEESEHSETTRALNKKGEMVEFYRGMYRMFFWLANPQKRSARRYEDALTRTTQAKFDAQRRESLYRDVSIYSLLSSFLKFIVPVVTLPFILSLSRRFHTSIKNDIITKQSGMEKEQSRMKNPIKPEINVNKQSNIQWQDISVNQLTELMYKSYDLSIKVQAANELIRRIKFDTVK